MNLITWNVQWCRGVDGRVDPSRIARTARALADFDVLCLQEIAINFGALPGSAGEDQMALLAAALPGYTALFVAATDVDDGQGGRRKFGNAIFTRLRCLQVFGHLLPWPPDPSVPSMQRGALEAVIDGGSAGLVRVISTHLEYYSPQQRMAQVEALRALHAQAGGHAEARRPDGEQAGSPFAPVARPASAVLCGDFNFRPDHPEHERLRRQFDEAHVPRLLDAWEVANPGIDHPITVGLHDPDWPAAYCCDFTFVSEDLAPRIKRVEVDAATQASDHQPVILEL